MTRFAKRCWFAFAVYCIVACVGLLLLMGWFASEVLFHGGVR